MAVGARGLPRRVGGRGGGCAASGVCPGENWRVSGADVGGSSNESFEDRSGGKVPCGCAMSCFNNF